MASSGAQKLRVLNLEDNPNDSELIQAELEHEWTEVELLRVDTRDAFVLALDQFVPDVVLIDFNLPDIDGREALHIVRQSHPEIPLIMVTGALGDIEAVELVKLGARDYVMKDRLQRLNTAVQAALSMESGIRSRKAAEKSLRQSEEEIRALVEHSPVAMAVDIGFGEDEKIVMINRRFTELFGYTLEDIPDLSHWWSLAYPDENSRRRLLAEWSGVVERAVLNRDAIEPREVTIACKDGTQRYVRVTFVSSGNRNIITFEDLTEHKRAEAHIQRLNQLYAVLSDCNKAIVRSNGEQELLAQVCRSAVRFGSFRMAWVGWVDPATRRVIPVVSAGKGAEEYLRDIKISVDADSEYGKGPTGTAIREDRPFWCEDFLGASFTAPWRERATLQGWRSSAALPLHREGVAVGAFTMYADEPYVFEEDVRELLIEMAQDIDYALDNFGHEVKRKQAEDALRKLSLVVEQSPNSIVITDLDANLEYVNEAFVRATGYSREEAIGQNPRILHSGKNPRAIYDEMWAHLTRGETWRGELINRRKDGSEYVEAILVSPVRDTGGRTTHYLAIKEDITERKRVEQALLESEQKFRVMTASAQDAIAMVDNDGNVSFWNAAAEKIFGYAAEEVIGRELHQLLAPPRYREAYLAGFSHFRQTGEGDVIGKTLDLAALHKDGHEFPVELSLSAVNIGGKWQAIGIMRDITERKQGEARAAANYESVAAMNAQLLESNKQLEQAKSQLLQSEKMAAIGLLAAGVAHEINNPVGYVNSNLGTLEKYLADIFVIIDKYEAAEAVQGKDSQLLAELRQFKTKVDFNFLRQDIKSLIAESHQGLERIKKIIRDLKDFSRSDVDEQWVWADVHHGLDTTLNVVWNELKYKCEVVKEYGDLPEIWCLPSQLNQVFMNLLVNAAQAIEVRGRITIRTGAEGERVWIEVSDTGKGISPENIPRLFDPFFTTKPVGLGTGLGLSVSYKIVEKHHGKIEVHSEPGKGSTFRVWLPVQSSAGKIRTV
ncbi:MAG TPA: PAS domain S-box protein [Gallionella sp.]|nr:PAS domain S-box protein [Gallionella sp.]